MYTNTHINTRGTAVERRSLAGELPCHALDLQLQMTYVHKPSAIDDRRSGDSSLLTRAQQSAVAEMGDRGHNRHGPKRGGAAAPLSLRAGTPSNTMWPRPRSTSVPNGVFIHPVVWPQ